MITSDEETLLLTPKEIKEDGIYNHWILVYIYSDIQIDCAQAIEKM